MHACAQKGTVIIPSQQQLLPLFLALPNNAQMQTSSKADSGPRGKEEACRYLPAPTRAKLRTESPGVRALVQWMVNGGQDGRGGDDPRPHPQLEASSIDGGTGRVEATGGMDGHPAAPPASPAPIDWDAFDTLVNATAIKTAVRLQPLGYRPGVMGGRVGLLESLRTPDMDKYDEMAKPKTRRAPPTDLSDLTAEQIVERRNRLAREYSKFARGRRGAACTMLERDVAAFRVMRNVIEKAPGIAYLTVSGDMRGLVLHANEGAEQLIGVTVAELLGRSFIEAVHPNDRPALCELLVTLVLSKNPYYSSNIRLRIGRGGNDSQLVDARFRFGAFGVACSLWEVQ